MGVLEVLVLTLGCATSHPQTPFFDFQAFPVPAITPTNLHPAPQFKSYEPAYHKPEPVYHKPEPVYHKPAPTYSKHVPLYNSAGPPYHHPPVSYGPKIPKIYAKHPPAYKKPAPPTYTKPAPLPAFVNLGPGQYQPTYAPTAEAPDEEAEPMEDEEEEVAEEEVVVVEEEETPYQPSYTTTVAPSQELVAVGANEDAVVDDVTDDVEVAEMDKSIAESAKPEKLIIELPTEKPMMMEEKTTRRVPVVMKTKGTGSVKRVPVMMRTKTTSTTAPMKMTMTKEQLDVLVDMAVERLHEMEETMEEMKELEEDGLVVLEPQGDGDIISVDSEADLDGMNIVEF